MDGGAFAAEVLRLQIKKSKINKLIHNLNAQNKVIQDNLSKNVDEINKVYNKFLNGSGDDSDGSMITYFEETVELRQEKFNIIAKSLEEWSKDMNKEKEKAQELLVRTEQELDRANAALAAFIKAQFEKEQEE